MKPLTEGEIKAAQVVIEQVMKECGFSNIRISNLGFTSFINYDIDSFEADLSDLYINRLHEMAGTEPPPF